MRTTSKSNFPLVNNSSSPPHKLLLLSTNKKTHSHWKISENMRRRFLPKLKNPKSISRSTLKKPKLLQTLKEVLKKVIETFPNNIRSHSSSWFILSIHCTSRISSSSSFLRSDSIRRELVTYSNERSFIVAKSSSLDLYHCSKVFRHFFT